MIFGTMPNNLLQKPITDMEAIKTLLPHRKPMIMVDTFRYFDGEKGIAELTILGDNIFVHEEHFVESGLIEHMAQTAALFTGYKHQSMNLPVKEGFIASIKNLNIIALPKVNDVVSTEVQITYEMNSLSIVKLTSSLKNNIMASAEMNLVLNDKP